MKTLSPRSPDLSVSPGQHLPCSAGSEWARAVQPRAERGCSCLLAHTSPFPTQSPRQVQSEAPPLPGKQRPECPLEPPPGTGVAARRSPAADEGASTAPGARSHSPAPPGTLYRCRSRLRQLHRAAPDGRPVPRTPPQPCRGAPDPRVGRPPPAARLQERLLPGAPQN